MPIIDEHDGALPIIDFSSYWRSPDIRLFDLRFDTLRLNPPFSVSIDEPNRTMLYHVRHGSAWLEVDQELIHAAPGTIIGVEIGRLHRWRHSRRRTASRPLVVDDIIAPASDAPLTPGGCDIMMGSTHRREAVLRKLDHGVIVIREADDTDYAAIAALRAAQDRELALGPRHDPGIVRRLAEAITLCLVRYARAELEHEWGDLPKKLHHDERILRAFIAFSRQPNFPWTVKTLADVAGLSRTAFAIQFRSVVGEPPLECLKRLRLERAAASLSQGRSTLATIAQAVGYASASSLARAFHATYGVTPGEWRERAFKKELELAKGADHPQPRNSHAQQR